MLKIIKNSALIPTPIVDLKLDTEPRQGSTDPVTSEGVANAIAGASGALDERLTAVEDCIPDTAGADNKLVTQSALDAAEAGWQAGYTPKGEASVSTLNGLTGQSNGDTYILTDSGTLTDGSLAVSAGDSVAWDATNSKWYKVNQYVPEQLFNAVSGTSFSYSRIAGKVFYPNIDTSLKTIDFGGDFVIRSRGKVKTITMRSVSIVDSNNSAKHQVLLYSFDNNTFRIIAYNGKVNDDEVFVGIINVNNSYNYIGAWFPFSITIDGTTELAEAQKDIVDLEYFVGKVQNNTNSFKVVVDDVADADDTGNGFISVNTLSFSSNANLHTLYFNNKGYNQVFCHTGHANDQVSVITFYALAGSDKYPIGSVRSVGENNHDYSAVVPENCDVIAISYRTDGSYTDKFAFSLVRTMATKLQCNNSGYNRVSVDVSTPITWHKKAANRIAGCIDNVVPLSKCVINLDVGATIQYALRQMDSSGTLIKDSGWKTGQNEFVIQRNAVLVDIWARNPDDSNFSNDDITTMQSNFSNLDFVVFDFSDVTAGMSFVREVQEFAVGASKKIIRNVAHQGYSITSRSYGDSRLSSYTTLAQNGFDFGECDVQWSGDDVPVCCHDTSFVDQTSGDTIVIADHTAAELKTYNYYGETIATFEEILAECKKQGVGLYIDKTGGFLLNHDDRKAIMFGLITEYEMEDDVVFLVTVQAQVDALLAWYDKASIGVLANSAISSTEINLANGAYNGKNYVFIDASRSHNTTSDVITAKASLSVGVKIEMWTIDDVAQYKSYFPYVAGITSNKLSDFIVNK